MRLYTWNVNGVRAITQKGFLEWFHTENPDLICLQETRASVAEVPPEVLMLDGYGGAWMHGRKKGYSGVGAIWRLSNAPDEVTVLGDDAFDCEGRAQALWFKDYMILNCYFPNSQPERKRLDYKLAFIEAVRAFCGKARREGREVIICGDFNIAHKDIDLANPQSNHDNPGFYPEERAALDALLADGYADVFRDTHPGEVGHYTWWSYRFNARIKNIGWRIDYHLLSQGLTPRVHKSAIYSQIMGSDHCPVMLEMK